MKRLFLLLALLGIVATGCSKDEVDKGNDNKTEQPNENEGGNENDDDEKPVFEIDAEGSYTIPAEGAEITVNITTNLEYRVEVSEDAKAWLSIGDTRAVRTETLVFTASKNESDRERTATITIFNKDDEKVFEFSLIQKFNDKEEIPENIFFGLDKESVTISPDGGSVDVIVYSNYKWEISGTSDWCTPSVKSGDANEDGQKVTFSADMTYDDREATFWFRCANEKIKFVVSQKLKQVIIPDANNSFIIPADGGVAVISYQTSVDCKVIIPKDAQSWITIAPATRGLVSESITLDIAENTTYSSRTAVIKVVAKDNAELVVEYTINQEQKNGVLVDGNNTFTVLGIGGSVLIKYQANVDCDVIIPDEAQDWVTIAPATRGLSTYSTTLNIAENNSGKERNCVVKVVSQDDNELSAEYTIIQNPCYCLCYTSINGEVVKPYISSAFGATIISNTYIDGVGVIEFDIPITTIGNKAFYECSSLTSVTIPDSVTTIGEQAFYCCYLLTSVTIPDGVTTIGNSAFAGCASLTSVNIPDSVTSIGKSAFALCYDLTSVTIPDSVTSIGDDAFYDCDSLTSITIPNSVTSIGDSAFYDCDSLTSITIPNSVTSIGDRVFAYCESLTSVTIGDSVTTIGEWAFEYCSSLTSVTIGDSVTTIGKCAFYYCKSLTSVTIPDSVTSIGDSAFYDCDSLTSVTIGDSVTTIGGYAFGGCSKITEVNISDISAWCKIDFIDGDTSDTTNVTANPLYAGGRLYLNGEIVKDLVIPSDITEIKTMTFRGCSSLTSVTITDSVTTIGDYAFRNCSSLTSVTIPDSVTTIGWYAFSGCSSLTSVYCKAVTPPAGGYNMFKSNAYGRKIYVPTESVEAYKSATYWRDYADAIVGYDF